MNYKKNIKNLDFSEISECMDLFFDFSFLKLDDYKKLKRIIKKYFYKDTPFGKMIDENKVELLKKIYLKIKK